MTYKQQQRPATADTSKPYDVVIIGAGLAGLSSGLRLQTYGAHVAIIERRERVGGLCGTYNNNGQEMVIACNDFGLGMETMLHRLGVEVNFTKSKTRILYHNKAYSLPPDFRTIVSLASHPIQLFRYYRALKRSWKENHSNMDLETLVNNTVSSAKLRDLLKLPAYLMGVSPNALPVQTLHHEFDFQYGYWQPTTPVGGPQAMVDTMAGIFCKRGDIFLDTEFIETRHSNNAKTVITDQNPLITKYVVNTAPQYSRYPTGLRTGLPISVYELVVDKTYKYPENVHTIVHYPANISDWFSDLEAGTMPLTFGFHLFRSDLPNNSDSATMNIFFYLPRNMEEPTHYISQIAEHYIFTQLEHMLPGINQSIKEMQFISATNFEQKHGMSSRVTPIITPSGFSKPGNYDPERDLYLAGSSVYPPGEHAGAAVLSGVLMADKLGKELLHKAHELP